MGLPVDSLDIWDMVEIANIMSYVHCGHNGISHGVHYGFQIRLGRTWCFGIGFCKFGIGLGESSKKPGYVTVRLTIRVGGGGGSPLGPDRKQI